MWVWMKIFLADGNFNLTGIKFQNLSLKVRWVLTFNIASSGLLENKNIYNKMGIPLRFLKNNNFWLFFRLQIICEHNIAFCCLMENRNTFNLLFFAFCLEQFPVIIPFTKQRYLGKYNSCLVSALIKNSCSQTPSLSRNTGCDHWTKSTTISPVKQLVTARGP